MQKARYGAIDGLRTIACIGIVMMHMRANNSYEISGFVYEELIPAFTNFVFLFMVISAFGMCCGYLDRILNNQVSMEAFYIKRYSKILPFFTLLVLLDVVMSPSKASLTEGFADITLLFGLFPNNISVIGVGWFLGLIFAFYLIFPFFCVLLKTRRRAWCVFFIALLLNYACDSYFEVGRTNIVYCLCYLVAGGLIYLYRNELENISRKYWWAFLSAITGSSVLYFAIGANTVTMLLVSLMMLVFALGCTGGALQNKFTKFFSSISMEVYLSHMVVFRAIKMLKLNRIVGNGWLQYVITVVGTVCGAVVFAVVVKKILSVIGKRIESCIS